MQIGLDLRFLKSDNKYSTFVAVLIQNLIHTDTGNIYTLYLSNKTKTKFPVQLKVEYIKEEPSSLTEQIKFNSKLKKDKNFLMIFFNEKKPLLYKGDYILFIKDLKELHYQEETNLFKKYIKDLFLNISLKNSKKIICFENQTKHELNEKLNIDENKIEILYPFFNLVQFPSIKIITDIKTKFSIKGEYFIYSGGKGSNKNLSKLIEIISKLNKRKTDISLVILEQDITEDINFRKDVVNMGIVEKVFFIGMSTPEEKKAFYHHSIGSIFPSLYESFPFDLTESISYKSPIIASGLKQTREIMGDSISYFSPVSTIDIIEAIENFISKPKQHTDYKEISEKYDPTNTVKRLINIIKNV
ncbi:MAG: glycosyltransferase [Candidatus Gracilibacteria bacterium]|nr:glycosyltransferase [Candidatus Gracilibacteria bacterium]MDQ7022660.1 glycosyltransferase [Candidatus Gracilibacteria bacterium]